MILFYAFIFFYLQKQQLEGSQKNCLLIGCSCNFNNDDLSSVICKHQSLEELPKQFPPIPLYKNLINLIDVSVNSIDYLPNEAFAELSLVALNLSRNSLSSIENESFKSIIYLEKLYLVGNYIKELDVKGLAPLRHSLRVLTLSQNKLINGENSTDFAFSSLEQLEHLDLSHNRLERIPIINNLSKLKVLIINSNFIEALEVDNESQTCLPESLIELNLGENQLKYIHGSWFSNLHDLELLDLSSNKLSYISKTSFKSLSKLKRLLLNNNDLNHIPSSVFVKLNHLNHLDLSFQKNGINKIEDYALDREHVEEIFESVILTGNQIEEISGLAFCSKSNRTNRHVEINNLELKQNKLRNTNPCILKQINSNKNLQRSIFVSLDTTYYENVNDLPSTKKDKKVPVIDCYSCDPIKYLESYKIFLRVQVYCNDNKENKIPPDVCGHSETKDICENFKQFDCYKHDMTRRKSSFIRMSNNNNNNSLGLNNNFILSTFISCLTIFLILS